MKSALHPKVAELSSIPHEFGYVANIRSTLDFGVPLNVAIQYPHLVGSHCIEKERRMRGDKKLGLRTRRTALFAQRVQEPRVQQVLRLLDSNEPRWIRIVE